MGQRTQILLEITDIAGKKERHLYHYQWGHGRVMFMELMKYTLHLVTSINDKKTFDFVFDWNNIYNIDDELEEVNLPDNITSKEFTEQLVGCFDNTDGYLVIQLKEIMTDSPYIKDYNLNFGFLLNEYDYNKKEHRYIAWEKYADVVGSDFVDQDFRESFRNFIKHFELKELTN